MNAIEDQRFWSKNSFSSGQEVSSEEKLLNRKLRMNKSSSYASGSKSVNHSYFQPILVATFVTIATVKVPELIPYFYTWVNVLIN